jgi:threonine dehydratase
MKPAERNEAADMNLDFISGVERAYRRIKVDILRTELTADPELSRAHDADVQIKWDSRQRTGSFKLRGALNKIRSLPASRNETGLVSASTGNHGLAMCWAASREAVPLVLFLPETVAAHKLDMLRRFPVLIELRGGSCEEAEAQGRRWAEETARIFVSPYNDAEVVFGQGTVGLEIYEQVRDVQDVLVPVGGGGLAAGIAGYLKSRDPRVRVVGVEPEASAFMAASIRAGRIVSIPERPTAADAVAGGIEPGSITFDLCRALIDDWIGVTEESLREAGAVMNGGGRGPVEPAGALALAGLLSRPERFQGRSVVLVASGGNSAPLPKNGSP